jgi:hypothetical protein
MVLIAGLLPLAASAQQQNPSFNLVNKSTKPVAELYVTPAGDANWGQNRLVSGPIAPGESFAVRRRIDGNCIFDVRTVYADKTHEDRKAINTCNTADVVVGATKASDAVVGAAKAADDPSFRLTNHLKQPITELKATPKGKPLAANALGAGALPPDASTMVHPAKGEGCIFELRVVLADASVKNRTLDLCKVSELSIP